jgi:DNA-directed RNA polymerase specialized sigma24 family protein
MPAGVLVTVPDPDPSRVTVSGCIRPKVAVSSTLALIVMSQGAVPEQPPAPDPAGKVAVGLLVGSLPVRLREAFVLVEVFGLTYREAGEALDVPECTVKSRVFHARRRLVDWLASAEEGESGAV